MTAPWMAPPKPSILDRLAARLFPLGNYSGLLAPEQQQGLQRQGLLNVGLNLLQAGGAQPQQRGTLANLGASIQGVDVNQAAQQALQLQAYRNQQQEQQAIATVAARHPATPGMSLPDQRQRMIDIAGELLTIPGGARLAEQMSALIAAMKETPGTKREPLRIPDYRDNVLGSPTHGMIGIGLFDPETYQRVGFVPQVQPSEVAKPNPQQVQHAEFGAAALAAWQPVERIRSQHPGVEEEVGKLLTSPKFAEAVPGFRSSGDAVAAIARAGGSAAAQQYMRAKWSFLDNVLRTRYATGRLGGPMLAQMAQEFLPGLDVEGNAQVRQNEIQSILSAQGESGFDLNPSVWNQAVKRHGVANVDLQSLLQGQSGDARLNAIRNRNY